VHLLSCKEALQAEINEIEDVENNKPLKEAIKSERSRLAESRGNLKRKAKEKISSLTKGSGYKIFAALQFPPDGDKRIVHRKRRRTVKRKSSRSTTGKKSKNSKEEEKENSCYRKKDKKIIR